MNTYTAINVGTSMHPVAQTLSEVGGVVVRQKAQALEVVAQLFGIPYEAKNKYRIHLLPPNKVVKNHPRDPDGWEPTEDELDALDTFLFAKESSLICSRFLMAFLGCRHLRPLKIHFTVARRTGDVYIVDRPFKCGGCCCSPLEMNVDAVMDRQAPRRIGRVREDFSPYLGRCMSSCCLATTYTDIDRALPDGSYEKAYTMRTNLSCCGRVNNCCGATCCKNDAVYDILDTKGTIVAHLQRTYARGRRGCTACLRMGVDFNNYILEFPRNSTAEDRVLLITALFQVEFQHFERSGES